MEKETKKQVIERLRRKYCLSLPWELDDALYYAQLQYPEITVDDLLNG